MLNVNRLMFRDRELVLVLTRSEPTTRSGKRTVLKQLVLTMHYFSRVHSYNYSVGCGECGEGEKKMS
jgi:hypothetical protein